MLVVSSRIARLLQELLSSISRPDTSGPHAKPCSWSSDSGVPARQPETPTPLSRYWIWKGGDSSGTRAVMHFFEERRTPRRLADTITVLQLPVAMDTHVLCPELPSRSLSLVPGPTVSGCGAAETPG